MRMAKKRKNATTVRKHLFEDDIVVLMSIRGMESNTFPPLSGTDPKVYRPRTTQAEWKKILQARKKAVKTEAEAKVPDEAVELMRRVLKNQSLTTQKKEQVLIKHLDVDSDTLHKWAEKLKLPMASSEFAIAKSHQLKKSKRYIISSAQNASSCNVPFLRNIEAYAKFISAEIGIIATRYKNPTSVWHKHGEFWDKEVHPYLTAKRHTLHKHLELLADLKVQATAPNPTNGIELFGDERSCIVGSPRIEMRSLPVLASEHQKFLYSTGTVTSPSFTDTVAGGKAKEHHTYGFIVVEIESDEIIHMRSVSAHSDGSFQDLTFKVADQKISRYNVDTMVLGDIHFAQKDERVTNANRKMMRDMSINTAVLHDTWDSESINVHNANNPVVQHELALSGKDDLQKEIDQLFDELSWFGQNIKRTLVVSSNHDDMLDRAMITYDWKSNMKNAKVFVELLGIKLSGDAEEGLIPFLINEYFDNVYALGREESYMLHGVQVGLHGHRGPNGARGNINAFSRLPVKTITGHSHSPAIKWGAYQVGIACSMKHGYNIGLSSWAYANCLLNDQGKRQMIVLNKDTLTYTTLFNQYPEKF